jgi:hypothetical protein
MRFDGSEEESMTDETIPAETPESIPDEELDAASIEIAIPMNPGAPPDETETSEETASSDEEELSEETDFSPEAFLQPGPDSGVAPKPGSPLDSLDELVDTLITDEALVALWQRANRAQELVREKVKALGIARELFTLIQAARNAILAGKNHYEEAERFINEVEYRVELSGKMGEWTKIYGFRLFIYEMAWAVVSFLILFFWMSRLGETFFLDTNPDFVYFVGCMMWGGIGGVIGALISLVKHIAIEQDFDRQHVMWYISSPLVGYGVGAVVFLIIRAGLFSLSGPGQAITSPFIMYTLAWLCGYQQNVFTDILKRILKIFEVGNKEEE